MTTATASGAYPFLAEGGLGAEGIYIGRDVHAEASFCFDPFALYGKVEGFTNPNVLLAGVIGQGKSALAKSFALRSIAFGYRVYVPCDPKGEWTPVAQALGGTSIALGPGLPGKLNPLDAAPRPNSVSEADWAGEIRKRRLLLLGSLARTVLGRDLLPMEHTGLDVALDAVVTRAAATGRTPLLGDIAATLNNPDELDVAERHHVRPPRRRLPRPGPRHAQAGPRRPRRDVRRPEHGGLRSQLADAHYRPVPPGRIRRRHRLGLGDDLRVRVDGIRTVRPKRRPSAGSSTTKPGA